MTQNRLHFSLALDNVGCLSVVVLTAAFHWALASRLGLGAFVSWLLGLASALFVVALIVGRKTWRTKSR